MRPKTIEMETDTGNLDLEIGRGRSGTVFKSSTKNGKDLAVKVFSGVDELTNFVNYIFTGAPNAYSWSEDAVKCAHYRREILSTLISYWFDSRVRIANSYGVDWNEEAKAYKIKTEFITGRPVNLHHPFSSETDWELNDLTIKVMKPLQKRLIESGFDGLVWQAGKGNPIALNNFLLDNEGNWVWIDAESGVPALFPLNPLSLFSFYLPHSFKRKRALFDDVNTKQLKRYLKLEKDELTKKIGATAFDELMHSVGKLEKHQQEWKSIRRIKKSITYNLKKDKLTQEQADWYSKNQLAWYSRELTRLLKKGIVKIIYKLPAKVIRKLLSINYWQLIKNTVRFVFIGKYRKESVEELVKSRIAEWENRGQLSKEHADYLRDQAEHESTSPYLADFIILIGLKPLTNIIELLLLPTLYAMGVINEATLAIGVTLGGVIYRTAYTAGKMIYEHLLFSREKRNSRWIALIVGMIPTIGNAAYPTQMVYSASSKSKELAEFLVYDIMSRVGAKIPIWGGKDTQTEHFFNHLPNILIRKRKSA